MKYQLLMNFEDFASLQALVSSLPANAKLATVVKTEAAEELPEEKSHHDIGQMKADMAAAAGIVGESKETKKRGRPAKAAAPEVPAMPPAEEKKPIVLENLIAAFQKFAREKSREEAGKLIASYGCKSVRDLPAEKYEEILGRLS